MWGNGYQLGRDNKTADASHGVVVSQPKKIETMFNAETEEAQAEAEPQVLF